MRQKCLKWPFLCCCSQYPGMVMYHSRTFPQGNSLYTFSWKWFWFLLLALHCFFITQTKTIVLVILPPKFEINYCLTSYCVAICEVSCLTLLHWFSTWGSGHPQDVRRRLTGMREKKERIWLHTVEFCTFRHFFSFCSFFVTEKFNKDHLQTFGKNFSQALSMLNHSYVTVQEPWLFVLKSKQY